MIPGMNPRQMQKAMQRMGIQQEEIDDAEEVIIRCSGRKITISNPSVSKVNMMGQETWQVIGKATEEAIDSAPEISEEDIETVMAQANCTEEEARAALEENKGDIAAAIIQLKK
jgi:nascent polypeptide-associated complex subunit alpha